MIKVFPRIYSQVFRDMTTVRRDPFRLSQLLIWPLLVLLPMTLFVNYIEADVVYVNLIILGLMGSTMIEYLGTGMIETYVEEHDYKSLPNLFASPIKRHEYVIGSAIGSLLKAAVILVIYGIFAYFINGFVINDWVTFFMGMVFFALIGFSIGLVILGIAFVIPMKDDALNLTFVFTEAIALASGIFYSVESVYPPSILPFINLLPTTHAFNLFKSMLGLGSSDIPLLALLVAAWLAVSLLFNGWMYEKGRASGRLARFE